MKNIISKYSNILFPVLILFVIGISSCKKSNDVLAPMRLFTPGGTISVINNVSNVILSWDSTLYKTSSDSIKYAVQVSKDSSFVTVERNYITNIWTVMITDDSIAVRQKYYARVRALGKDSTLNSHWLVSSGFTIMGEQDFLPVRELEIKETSVVLRWTKSAGLSKITVKPTTGNSIDFILTAADTVAGLKTLTGLQSNMTYTAEIFTGTKSKGTTLFTTLPVTAYTVTLNSGDDLAAAITNAANNDIIGLNPGTYTAIANYVVAGKFVTIKSVSADPTNTKVIFKEFTLKGDGAGIKLSGIEFDGLNTAYFINLTGLASDAAAAKFTNITVEKCIIHNTANCILRANRGAVGAHKIDAITITNCKGYDNGGAYDYFTLDKITFGTLTLTKSTFYNIGRNLITCPTVLTGATAPTILIDMCTFNNFGSDGKYALLDANTNPINFTLQNSIICNVPKPGAAVAATAIRASVVLTMAFSNNNLFNFNTGASPAVALTLPTGATNNKGIDLGWGSTTSDFTLPLISDLRTFSRTAGAIGDPRWAY
jgi:hypothetical protein